MTRAIGREERTPDQVVRERGGVRMPDGRLSRRHFLAGAVGASAALALPIAAAPAVKKGTSLRLWILKTYVEPTNKAIEASAQRWAEKHGAGVTVEYFTFEDMQTKYVAAIENKNTPDVGQLETGAPARFAGMGQLVDLTGFARQIAGEVGTLPANVAPVTVIDGKTYAIPWYIMPAFWYVWRDVFERNRVKLPNTFEETKVAAAALNRPRDNFYGMGQSWNRTADGYGVMQSLMYSYGVGWATKDGKYQSIKTSKMHTVMKWATDIYREGLQPADTLTWTGSGNNENFIAKNIAQTSNGPSITFAMENAVARATDAKERKQREEALANHLALPHPAGPDGRRMWSIAMSFGVFKTSKDPDAAMSLMGHLLSPEETLRVMRASYGQVTPVLDKARAASKEYFNKNENYRNFGRAVEWFVATGWPGPLTPAAAEVQASNVLTDAPAKVIVDRWSVDQAIDWADKKIKEIYDTIRG
jgi:multiple sugar transport system substrate-binding protein